MSNFYIDTRSLASFRILISLVIIHDLAVRLSDFTLHYTDNGILPLNVLIEHYTFSTIWTVITTNSTLLLVTTILGIIAAVLMLLAINTRLMAIICWVALISIQIRNPIIYQGGDDMLRMVLFWFIWLPCYSGNKHTSFQIHGWAVNALLLQTLFPFFFSGVYKGTYEWWTKGTALYYALHLDQITRYPGLWLRQFPTITIIMTRAVFLTELIILPLFLLSLWKEYFRTIVFIILVSFSVAIIILFMIGLFPLCILACSVLFIPSSIWNRISNYKLCVYENNQALSRSIVQNLILIFAFVLIVWWNIADLPNTKLKFPRQLKPVIHNLGLNQSWGMFAPTVFKDDGWLIFACTLNNGEIIDLNNSNKPIDYNKPQYVLDRFKNDRWRKYTEQLLIQKVNLIQPLCELLIAKHNRIINGAAEKKIKQLSIYYMLERTNTIIDKNQLIERILIYDTILINPPL